MCDLVFTLFGCEIVPVSGFETTLRSSFRGVRRREVVGALGLAAPLRGPSAHDDDDDEDEIDASSSSWLFRTPVAFVTSRREALVVAAAAAAAAPRAARAEGPSSLADVALRLRRVPVFACVDASGRPYMIVDANDGKVPTGYFFTDARAAREVLDEAVAATRASGSDEWVGARVAAVPLDYALKLQSRRPRIKVFGATPDRSLDTVYDVLPLAADADDALAVGGTAIFKERGRVPLFYEENFDVDVAVPERIPVYFRKADLLRNYYGDDGSSSSSSSLPPPKIRTIELVETFSAILRDRSNPIFKALVFVPPKDSVKAVKECEQARGDNVAYRTDEMILVRGK